MSKVEIKKPGREELENMGVFSWPVWSKEASRFPWFYDITEECYILEGEIVVTDSEGREHRIGPGDFVTFYQGLECEWHIIKPVKKHYNFKG